MFYTVYLGWEDLVYNDLRDRDVKDSYFNYNSHMH